MSVLSGPRLAGIVQIVQWESSAVPQEHLQVDTGTSTLRRVCYFGCLNGWAHCTIKNIPKLPRKGSQSQLGYCLMVQKWLWY